MAAAWWSYINRSLEFVIKAMIRHSPRTYLQDGSGRDFQDSVMMKLGDIEKSLCRLDLLEQRMTELVEGGRDQQIHDRLASIDQQLRNISRALGEEGNEVQPDESRIKAGTSIRDQDRKRLKERLKEVMTLKHEELFDEKSTYRVGIVESIFGICKPDGRIGKEGSRYPASMLNPCWG